jgi:N-acetylglucosaminyldiphosphoundecaprenol N-acetyl-beta-D-mannosaminyltransferase
VTERVRLLGIDISRFGLVAALDAVHERIEAGAGGYVCFVNVHSITESTRNMDLRHALDRAAYCFADGMPLVWLSRVARAGIAGRVCGPDFMDALLRRESAREHGFIGGAPGCAEAIARRFGISAVTYSPPMREFSAADALDDWRAFGARCSGRKSPRIVWVGLGAPKQELWLDVVSRAAPDVLFFGVGAAFDFLAGWKPRAPRVMQRGGLEWAHRLASDPRRLWKRYATTSTRFLVLAAGELIARR